MLVKQNIGVSWVPLWAGLERFSTRRKIMPVDDGGFTRAIVMLTKANNQRPNMMEALLQALCCSQ
jgi:DNA-binding transcriptional LysR family regulator